jgi:hypothetical protein
MSRADKFGYEAANYVLSHCGEQIIAIARFEPGEKVYALGYH